MKKFREYFAVGKIITRKPYAKNYPIPGGMGVGVGEVFTFLIKFSTSPWLA